MCELPRGRRLVRTKWVYRTKKEGDRIIKWKARLVAISFTQLAGIDFTETYSPVARFTCYCCTLLSGGTSDGR